MITNPNPGTFMRNLEIQDELQAEGIKIIPGTVAVISGGKNIASECKITFDPSGRSYEIITPLALEKWYDSSNGFGRRKENRIL